jgi:hypothetical protein
MRLRGDRDVGHHRRAGQLDAGHGALVVVGHPQRPAPTARLWGLAPVLTGRPTSRLACGSIHVTLSPPEVVTQTARGVATTSRGVTEKP